MAKAIQDALKNSEAIQFKEMIESGEMTLYFGYGKI